MELDNILSELDRELTESDESDIRGGLGGSAEAARQEIEDAYGIVIKNKNYDSDLTEKVKKAIETLAEKKVLGGGKVEWIAHRGADKPLIDKGFKVIDALAKYRSGKSIVQPQQSRAGRGVGKAAGDWGK
jgi:hypothetical protein